jgi:two-component system chemotaxis response regulator CheB
MILRRVENSYRVSLRFGPRICYQRPSVDVLFESVAEAAGARAVGVLLTGMGADGAAGMLKMRLAGAYNIAQDESTSVVYGMPREAVRRGAVDQVLPLHRIAGEVMRHAAAGPRSLGV